MAQAIKKIRQDLAKLDAAAAEIEAQMHGLYGHYCACLYRTVRQQLVLAGYQICTQVYPEKFLKLSFSQRQTLQEQLKQLGEQMPKELPDLLRMQTRPSPPKQPDPDIIEQMLRKLSTVEISSDSESSNEGKRESEGDATVPSTSQSSRSTEAPAASDLSNRKVEVRVSAIARSSSEQTDEDSVPQQILQWQQRLEQTLRERLHQLSQDANVCLQNHGILTNKLPAKVLEMALQAEDASSGVHGPPNILNMLVDISGDGSAKGSHLLKIVAIQLRLTEIELNAPKLSGQRQQIRALVDQTKQLLKQYQKKQREYAIAEAESAWRSSWYEDER